MKKKRDRFTVQVSYLWGFWRYKAYFSTLEKAKYYAFSLSNEWKIVDNNDVIIDSSLNYKN